ncbi:MAG: prepilin-type N-terminal cleavage/methylation domain-containing protein [Burkholderiaceae bacterium]|jgi:general secretion pathway protein J|nr:prepilin-type N-terminal cleavage/methylation domain-containing protein [Burkholderiaceae bacterium]
MARQAGASGFTLIELLVAVTILAVVAALGWRGLDAVARSRDDASSAFTASSRLADGMQQLGDDLRHATSEGAGLPAVSLLGGGLFIVRRPAQPLGGDVRTDVSADVGLPPNAGELQVVRWTVQDGALKRSASAPTESRATLQAALQNPVAPLLTILPGVTTMQIQFYRYAGIGLLQQSGAWVNPGTAANAPATASATPATAASAAATAITLASSAMTPAAVRVRLQFADRPFAGELQRDFLLDDHE